MSTIVKNKNIKFLKNYKIEIMHRSQMFCSVYSFVLFFFFILLLHFSLRSVYTPSSLLILSSVMSNVLMSPTKGIFICIKMFFLYISRISFYFFFKFLALFYIILLCIHVVQFFSGSIFNILIIALLNSLFDNAKICVTSEFAFLFLLFLFAP